MTDNIFLIGGLDLEMQTIMAVLENRGVSFHNRGLNWGNALLSAYSDVLETTDTHTIYGVELQEDITVPKNYIRIDHHNDYSERPSSLHQVCELLGVEMTRSMRLISANDSSYIPGMEKLGATKKEIEEIRLADRKAQGITEKDEEDAERSVREYSERRGCVTLVRSIDGSPFSPIVDRLYPYGHLIIYSSSEMACYGFDIRSLSSMFKTDVIGRMAYFGGGQNGFFGFVKGFLTERMIKDRIELILETI